VISRDGAPILVDFALAAAIAGLRPEFTHHTEIVGTLAYLAPEQTGRTGRWVDQRADLYALGATLYELATGAPPFGTGDPLRLTHDHLARVPVAPAEVHRAVPEALSQVILRLLEKEPDRRYQTADGVLYDLERLRHIETRAAGGPIRIGEHDFPLHLRPPSRLVGRDDEVAALGRAFDDALAGRCRGVLVSGAPGVGKTALVDELRPVVTGRDGWFVAGKFDPYRRDLEFDAVHQALRALGRLLLSEPEDELAEVLERVLRAVGPNAGLLTAALPEFAALLRVPPDAGDPLTARARVQRTAVQVLRAVASRARPLVVFVDDLQWAGPTPLGVVDLVLREEQIDGLLLVGAYRDGDVGATRPLAPFLSRWREQTAARHVRLGNLPVSGSVAMVAEMLHVDRATATGLGEVLAPRMSGNPYETVELLDALRREGLLTATVDGWRWDEGAVRAHLGEGEMVGLLATRVEALPPRSRAIVEAMACLGGRVELSLLQAATGGPDGAVDPLLAAAFDDGLLVAEPGPRPAVRFRHDRIREAILGGLDQQRRRVLQLAMAQRLSALPEHFAAAAEQYLPVVDAVDDPGKRKVVGLLTRAADQAKLIGDYALVNALLTAALRLMDPCETATLIELHTGRHAALYGLGRLDEADAEYRTIELLGTTATERADATAAQVRSLTNRNRYAEAVGLGLESLRELGIAVPAGDRLAAELDYKVELFHRWLDQTDGADDLARPEITDRGLLCATHVINAVLPVAYFAGDLPMYVWLSLEALRIWSEHGPSRTLIGSAGIAAFAAVGVRGEYAAGYQAMRRVLALGEARGYEPDTSQARFLFAALSCWFEPIENGVQAAERARDGLIAGGDLANAGWTYQTSAMYLQDCATSLEVVIAAEEAGLAFARRTGSPQAGELLEPYRWLAGVLRGESSAAVGEGDPAERYAGNPLALLNAHITAAIAAAIFGDPPDLARHTAAAMPLLSASPGAYATAVARLLRGLALAEDVRAGHEGEPAVLLSQLDEVMRWVAARAADAPGNFLHLLRLIEAERAWAVGDFRAAAVAFDAGRHEAGDRQRPWHRALITERAARFHLAHGLEQTGYELLAQARQDYAAWGASAKVAQLDWAYPTLRLHSDVPVTTGTVDLLGILSASQALSSETSIEGLHARVVDVLGAMMGATAVQMLLWSDDGHDWLQAAAPGNTTRNEREAPMSVLRYVERTRQALVVDDATRDDRFVRDPYFVGLEACSLLAVPIVSRGALHAVLLLENRLIRGAFTTERLDAVKLIAGQLAVSLDNVESRAQLVASRARIVAAGDEARKRVERNLHDGAQQRVVNLAIRLKMLVASDAARARGVDGDLEELVTDVNDALEQLRDISQGLHPRVLSTGGLQPALTALAQRSSIPVTLNLRLAGRVAEAVETATYYVVAEMLTNAVKHAEASRIDVDVVHLVDGALRVRVHDDGVGGADPAGGSGLVGLRDRVEALGGTITLDSPQSKGTTLVAELPLPDTVDSAQGAARA
jgi:signal transduction histidine kinase